MDCLALDKGSYTARFEALLWLSSDCGSGQSEPWRLVTNDFRSQVRGMPCAGGKKKVSVPWKAADDSGRPHTSITLNVPKDWSWF